MKSHKYATPPNRDFWCVGWVAHDRLVFTNRENVQEYVGVEHLVRCVVPDLVLLNLDEHVPGIFQSVTFVVPKVLAVSQTSGMLNVQMRILLGVL